MDFSSSFETCSLHFDWQLKLVPLFLKVAKACSWACVVWGWDHRSNLSFSRYFYLYLSLFLPLTIALQHMENPHWHLGKLFILGSIPSIILPWIGSCLTGALWLFPPPCPHWNRYLIYECFLCIVCGWSIHVIVNICVKCFSVLTPVIFWNPCLYISQSACPAFCGLMIKYFHHRI